LVGFHRSFAEAYAITPGSISTAVECTIICGTKPGGQDQLTFIVSLKDNCFINRQYGVKKFQSADEPGPCILEFWRNGFGYRVNQFRSERDIPAPEAMSLYGGGRNHSGNQHWCEQNIEREKSGNK
jgi:hypothetical protein